jgi:hypothetical protein
MTCIDREVTGEPSVPAMDGPGEPPAPASHGGFLMRASARPAERARSF